MGRLSSPPRAGFTLVEVLLSMLLLGVGVGALLGTSVLTVRMVHRGRQTTRAVQAASAQLETLRAATRLPPGVLRVGSPTAPTPSPAGPSGAGGFGPPDGLLEATVTVLTAVPGGYREDSLTTVLPCP